VRVLIALDHSQGALRAARTAVEMLGPAGTELFVLNVAEVPLMWGGAGIGVGVVTPLDLDTLAAQVAEAEADSVTEDAAAAGITDAEVEVVAGDPVLEICRAAERHDVDLIVLGAHDRSLLRRMLVPSVSTGVVRETTRPVLVVPDPTT
jgi:nucleotide-binding universal stress UspA family protein